MPSKLQTLDSTPNLLLRRCPGENAISQLRISVVVVVAQPDGKLYSK